MHDQLPVDHSASNDAALIRRLGGGDQHAMAELYNQYAQALIAVGRAILRSETEAEDVLHDVFVKLGDRAGQYRESSGCVRAWLTGIMRNACIDRQRRSALRRRRADEVAALIAIHSEDGERTPRALDGRRMLDALSNLRPVHRRTIELLYCEGMSSSELARREGVPVGTVKSRASRALETLRSVCEGRAGRLAA
jgi:RNA polymerase sigma-70 factor (ECF subfamily)